MRQIIQTGKVVGPYSPAIVASGANFIFLSGQIATDLDANIRVQTQQIMKKIENLLENAGAFMSDVVKTTIYLTNIEDFKQVNEEYAKSFPSDPPTRSTLQAAALPLNAGLMIDVIAMR
ncbi:deaminase [Candidatus Heimdallarchaeota archaeon B3_Heim]|nr:MAG: deaminase [Candidatus Heimdallarchaeota archaeon B3_Heim]